MVILGQSVTLSRGRIVPQQLLPADLRLIIDDRGPGPRNMAVDSALLQSLDEDSRPTLRLYGFAPACLSLGRFQPISDIAENALGSAGVDLVRRPTGGTAVLHDDEVTYAMVLTRRHVHPFTKRGAYRLCADLLLPLLAALGVEASAASAAGHPAVRASDRAGGGDCFGTTSEFEIVAGGHKLVGSAQTTARGGSLQHGSIPLNASYRRIRQLLSVPQPELVGPGYELGPTSIEEAGGGCWTFVQARDALASGAIAQTGMQPERLRPEEEALAVQLEAERYRCEEWTRQLSAAVS